MDKGEVVKEVSEDMVGSNNFVNFQSSELPTWFH